MHKFDILNYLNYGLCTFKVIDFSHIRIVTISDYITLCGQQFYG